MTHTEQQKTYCQQLNKAYGSKLFSIVEKDNYSAIETTINGLTFTVTKFYNQPFNFFCANIHKLAYIEPNDYNKYETPKNMFTPNEKAIDRWLSFYSDLYAELRELSEERVKAWETFKSTLEGLNVVWQEENKKGYIESEYFDFLFSIGRGGYINTEIKTRTYKFKHSVDNFKVLSKIKLQ